MDKKHLLELNLKEVNYWWHVNRRQLVLEFLDSQGLSTKSNIGSGVRWWTVELPIGLSFFIVLKSE